MSDTDRRPDDPGPQEGQQNKRFSTQSEVAEHYGKTTSAIRNWKKDGMPGGNGGYFEKDIDAWLQTRPHTLARTNRPTDSGGTKQEVEIKKLKAELRIKEAEADRKEREERMAIDSICWKQDVERLVARVLTEFKLLLEDTPDRIAAQVPEKHRPQVREYAQLLGEENLLAMRDWIQRIEDITQIPDESAKAFKSKK